MSQLATGATQAQPTSTILSADQSAPQEFRPFYERRRNGQPMSISKRVGVALLFGGGFVVLYYLAAGIDLFREYTWMVGVMLLAAPLCLYGATSALRKLLPHLDRRIPQGTEARHRAVLFRLLTDRRLAAAGLLFSVLNVAMGMAFDPPIVAATAGVATYYVALFVLGFVCGMAAYGIFGVVRTIEAYFTSPNILIDFTAPDRCGGLRVLGQAIVKFAAVTLVMGVLIALYITLPEWGRQDESMTIRLLMASWLALPFVLSLIVLLWPALAAHEWLMEYREKRGYEMQRHLTSIRDELTEGNVSPEERQALQARYDYHDALRSELFRMRTWPFSIAHGAEYVSFFVANGFLSIPGFSKMSSLL